MKGWILFGLIYFVNGQQLLDTGAIITIALAGSLVAACCCGLTVCGIIGVVGGYYLKKTAKTTSTLPSYERAKRSTKNNKKEKLEQS